MGAACDRNGDPQDLFYTDNDAAASAFDPDTGVTTAQ